MKEKVLYFLNFLTGKLYRKKPVKPQDVRSILIVKLDEIGDMVYAIPVFDILKKEFPNAKITVYCKAITANLIENQASVDEIIHVWERECTDIWIEMRGNFTTWFYGILTMPKYRVDRGSVRLRNKQNGAQKQELYTNLEIIEPLLEPEVYQRYLKEIRPVIHTTPQNDIRAQVFLDAHELEQFCVFHTGARDAERRWPIERFQELAKVIQTRLNLKVLIVGGSEEKDFIQSKLPGFPEGTISYCGQGSLTDLKAICSKAKFFVGNESGPLHIASTCNIPVIALFGPGVRDVFYPIGDHVAIIHYFNEDGIELTGEYSLMQRISVAEVWGNIVKLLNRHL